MKMSNRREAPQEETARQDQIRAGKAHRRVAHRQIALAALKKCPLCNAINARANAECFICGWHGEFEVGAECVENALAELMDLCPELADSMARNDGWLVNMREELRSFWFRFVHRFSLARALRLRLQ